METKIKTLKSVDMEIQKTFLAEKMVPMEKEKKV